MDLTNIKPDETIDARNLPCPRPIHLTQDVMSSLIVNSVLEIWVADKGTKTDLRLWCTEKEQEFMGFLERNGYDSVFIRKIK